MYVMIGIHIIIIKRRIFLKFDKNNKTQLEQIKVLALIATAICCTGYIAYYLYQITQILGAIANK
jgi:uncharacterized membrane protein (DUF373 family)